MMHVRYLLLLALVLVFSGSLCGKEIPTAKPEEVGMSSAKLTKVDEAVERLIEQKRLVGGTVVIARHGKIVHFKSYGQMDRERDKAMANDAIVRIYSMTKAIATAAALTLVDEGKLGLDAPVSKHLPQLKDLKVHHKDGPVAVKREMTVRDLMRHTAGLTYGFVGDSPVERAYRKTNVQDRNSTLDEMTEKLSGIPLLYEPGTDWTYSVSIDVLGHVIEVVSEKKLDEFLEERIFAPLDMHDTGFAIEKSQLDRFAANYTSDNSGKLTLRDDPHKSRYLNSPKLLSGGGGLVSTARDYLRFLMMVSQGGELDGQRVLSEAMVKQMTTNQLPADVPCIKFGEQIRTGVGFGLGFSVRTEMSKWDPGGRVGEYGWGGAASTHYWVSPKDDLIVITLEQTMPYSFLTEWAIKGLVYDAIED